MNKSYLTALLLVCSLNASAETPNFGGADCNSVIGGSFPKMMMILDANSQNLPAQGVQNLSLNIMIKRPSGSLEGFILPNPMAGGALIAAVPLLGQVDAAAPMVTYQIDKTFVFGPSLTFVQRTSTWQTTNKANLCLSANIRPVEAAWELDSSILADFSRLIFADIKYSYEGAPVQVKLKSKTVSAADPKLKATLVTEENTQSFEFDYTVTYLKKSGEIASAGPFHVKIALP